jgi:hypothetical protein
MVVSLDEWKLERAVRDVGYPVEAVEAILRNFERDVDQTGTQLRT